MTPLTPDSPVHRLAAAIETTELSVRALVETALDRIASRDATLNAFTLVLHESARQAADGADVDIKAGRYRGPLHGIPLAFKDLVDVAGLPTTGGSILLGDQPATTDATVARRLFAAGADNIAQFDLLVVPEAAIDRPRCADPDAIAARAEIVAQWRNEAQPGAGIGDIEIACRSARAVERRDERETAFDLGADVVERQMRRLSVERHFAQRHRLDQAKVQPALAAPAACSASAAHRK